MRKTNRIIRVSDSFSDMVERIYKRLNYNGGKGKISKIKVTEIIALIFDENNINVEIDKKHDEIKIIMKDRPPFGL